MDNKQYQQRIMDINLMININLTIVIIGSFISIFILFNLLFNLNLVNESIIQRLERERRIERI